MGFQGLNLPMIQRHEIGVDLSCSDQSHRGNYKVGLISEYSRTATQRSLPGPSGSTGQSIVAGTGIRVRFGGVCLRSSVAL